MMKISSWIFASVSAGILAACSSAGPSNFAPAGATPSGHRTGSTSLAILRDAALTMPHFVQPKVHADRGRSFMRPHKKGESFLYVGDWSTNDVFVYEYPSGTPVGTITGNEDPYGMCVDRKGDVYVANFGNGTLNEYASGGTTVIDSYSPGGEPIGCAVSKTGELAITSFDPGEVVVYPPGKTTGSTTYSDSACEYEWSAGFDEKGDIIGIGEGESIDICALLAGSKTEVTLSAPGITIDFPGGTSWDGKYIALGAQESGGKDQEQSAIEQVTLSGMTLTKVGETVLDCDGGYTDTVNPFIFGKKNIWVQHKQGNTLTGPNLWCDEGGEGQVDFWHYPQGGLPFRTLDDPPAEPYGDAVSIGE